jgi:Flp pilus assembly protein TadG
MKPDKTTRKTLKLVTAFAGDQSGVAAAYVAVLIAVLVGFIGLAVDFGSYYTTHSQAAAAADAAALAGATQLDGRTGAIARATTAAMTTPLVNNSQDFAAGDATVQIVQVRFLHSLPPSDDDPITAAYVTDQDGEAAYIEVTTETLTKFHVFLSAVGAVSNDTRAQAVAGFSQSVCRIPPLMICNPWEATDDDIDYGWLKGKTLLVKTKEPSEDGGGGAWAPGDMGLLDPIYAPWETNTNAGAKEVALNIARVRPPFCFSEDVDVRPGQVDSMRNAINVMFDIYANPFFGSGKVRKDDLFRPALNVTKGYITTITEEYETDADGIPVLDGDGNPIVSGTSCDSNPADDDTVAMALPPDRCFSPTPAAGPPNYVDYTNPQACTSLSVATGHATNVPWARRERIGDGVWDIDRYWQTNHGTTPMPIGNTLNDPGYVFDPAYPGIVQESITFSMDMSRYDMYRYEMWADIIPDNKTGLTGPLNLTNGEWGKPQCFGGTTPIAGKPDRRITYMAVINCLENDVKGNSAGGLDPVDYVEMFIIRPIRGGSDTSLWLEFIRPVEDDPNGAAVHDLVQLYR